MSDPTLTLPLFLLREQNFTVQAIGQTALIDRIGPGGWEWFDNRLNEDPRPPTLRDIDAFTHAGWAVVAMLREGYGTDIVIPASQVLIAGPYTPKIYSPDGDGVPHLYNQELFQPHWAISQGIVAVHPS